MVKQLVIWITNLILLDKCQKMGWPDHRVVFKSLEDLQYCFSWNLVPLLTPVIIYFLIIISFVARCSIWSVACICLKMKMLRTIFIYLWILFMTLENCSFNFCSILIRLLIWFVCFWLLSCSSFLNQNLGVNPLSGCGHRFHYVRI